MEDAVHLGDERGEGALCQVELDEREAGLLLRLLDVRLLDASRVVVREGVDADHVVAPPEERLGEVRAEKAGAARDEVSAHG
jgi:hypothetical protein